MAAQNLHGGLSDAEQAFRDFLEVRLDANYRKFKMSEKGPLAMKVAITR